MNDAFTTIGSLLAAMFTGGTLYYIWRGAIPCIEVTSELVTEKECRCNLVLRNATGMTHRIIEIQSIDPPHSVVCDMAVVRADGTSVPNRKHYQNIIYPSLTVEPKNNGKFEFQVNKGIESAPNIRLRIKTTWSRIPLLKVYNHYLNVQQ